MTKKPAKPTEAEIQEWEEIKQASIEKIAPDETPEPDGPMTLSDVHAILADDYPGYSPVEPRGDASGLTFTLPNGASLKIERKRVKACANMEELRAYVGSLT